MFTVEDFERGGFASPIAEGLKRAIERHDVVCLRKFAQRTDVRYFDVVQEANRLIEETSGLVMLGTQLRRTGARSVISQVMESVDAEFRQSSGTTVEQLIEERDGLLYLLLEANRRGRVDGDLVLKIDALNSRILRSKSVGTVEDFFGRVSELD